MMSGSAESVLRQAVAAHQRGAVDDARRLYAEVLRLDPRNDAALGNLAIIAAGQGDLRTAEALLRQALELRPDDPVAWNNLCSVLQSQCRPADAVAGHPP